MNYRRQVWSLQKENTLNGIELNTGAEIWILDKTLSHTSLSMCESVLSNTHISAPVFNCIPFNIFSFCKLQTCRL